MNHPEHICRFNDAPQTCECYDAGFEKAEQEMKKVVGERLIIAYRSGIIDGKQGTNCEDVVIKEALSSLDETKHKQT